MIFKSIDEPVRTGCPTNMSQLEQEASNMGQYNQQTLKSLFNTEKPGLTDHTRIPILHEVHLRW